MDFLSPERFKGVDCCRWMCWLASSWLPHSRPTVEPNPPLRRRCLGILRGAPQKRMIKQSVSCRKIQYPFDAGFISSLENHVERKSIAGVGDAIGEDEQTPAVQRCDSKADSRSEMSAGVARPAGRVDESQSDSFARRVQALECSQSRAALATAWRTKSFGDTWKLEHERPHVKKWNRVVPFSGGWEHPSRMIASDDLALGAFISACRCSWR